MSWLPTLLTIILSILSQVNASDWIAAHPNIAMSLATLGGVINHLLPSPVSSGLATGALRSVVWLFLALTFMTGAPAHAFDVTVTGTQVNMVYQEPTANKTGTPLADLAETTGYYAAPITAQPIPCVTTPATARTGGGTITALCVVPIFRDQEADVRFTVTASDLSGNESAASDPVDRRLDFLAPGPPR